MTRFYTHKQVAEAYRVFGSPTAGIGFQVVTEAFRKIVVPSDPQVMTHQDEIYGYPEPSDDFEIHG